MAEPVTWIHLQPVNDAPTEPHQESRGCWCRPVYAIDIRSTFGRDDIRVLLHRSSTSDKLLNFIALHARKGEFVEAS